MASSAIEGERKVAIVLFANVVHSTSLAERLDEEKVQSIKSRTVDSRAVDEGTLQKEQESVQVPIHWKSPCEAETRPIERYWVKTEKVPSLKEVRETA